MQVHHSTCCRQVARPLEGSRAQALQVASIAARKLTRLDIEFRGALDCCGKPAALARGGLFRF